MPSDVGIRLEARARAAGVDLPPAVRDSLLAYYELLARWNRTINLTSLSDPDAAVDRLLLEPVLAARALPRNPELMDLGSGGGSPAIPLAIALNSPRLVMIESKGRKAAFLREAARAVGLTATVEAARFEEVAERNEYRGAMDVVSIRAVRLDDATMRVARAFAKPGGTIALFTSEESHSGEVVPLIGRAKLIKVNVPRGTPED